MRKRMNATTLDIGCTEEGGRIPADDFNSQMFSSRLGIRLREQHCPACNSLVYSRRHRRCGVCERELPPSFLFSHAEVERLDAVLQSERRRHKAWLAR